MSFSFDEKSHEKEDKIIWLSAVLAKEEKFDNFFVSEDLKSSKEETEYKLTFFYNSFNFC